MWRAVGLTDFPLSTLAAEIRSCELFLLAGRLESTFNDTLHFSYWIPSFIRAFYDPIRGFRATTSTEFHGLPQETKSTAGHL